jgi:hypothetical protein
MPKCAPSEHTLLVVNADGGSIPASAASCSRQGFRPHPKDGNQLRDETTIKTGGLFLDAYRRHRRRGLELFRRTARLTVRSVALTSVLLGSLAFESAWAASACRSAVDSFQTAVQTYVSDGRETFVRRFVSDGPLAPNASKGVQEQLSAIESALGTIQGASVLSAKELGARNCFVVAVLEYTNGPAYLVSNYYVRSGGIVPTSLRLEGDPDKAFSATALIQKP